MKRFYGRKLFEGNNTDDYFGDERIRPYLSYEKNDQSSYCIYCGRIADSREHLPSRVFLDEPLTNECTIVPACEV